jgi:hypothetical protein
MNDDISGLSLKSYLNATCSNTWTFETHAPSNERSAEVTTEPYHMLYSL